MPRRDIIVIGGSAGALPVLIGLVGALPADLPAAVFVVIHFSPHAKSHLAAILSRTGALPVVNAQDGEPVRPGCITVAQPDRHLILQNGYVGVHRGARETASGRRSMPSSVRRPVPTGPGWWGCCCPASFRTA